MAEITDELMEQLANEDVVDFKKGVDYHNRIVMTTESGHVITADIMSIQTPEERVAELEQRISLRAQELAELEAERVALETSTSI